jgi:hypothetical protein
MENARDMNILVRKQTIRDSLLQNPNMAGRKTERLVLEKQRVNTSINNFIIIFTHYEANQPPPFSN